MTSFRKLALAAASISAFAVPAQAAVITLDFEGLSDLEAVGNFYDGGMGTNYGVSFSADALAIIDEDAGGTGNFANEPSASTVMFFLSGSTPILNYAAGFDTGFSFFYSSSTAATVSVYDGLDGTGNLLGSINLIAQFNDNCAGDPQGNYCNWTNIGVAFGGTARSINFGGTPDETGFDNITFGSAVAGGAVPEPTTWAMMIGGFGAIGGAMRMRRRKVSVRFA
ncbi:MAG: PEPxxWA-CTERM sorting domain-containing protein [Sphingomonadaceae bacterium]